jgi:hypothetical protein
MSGACSIHRKTKMYTYFGVKISLRRLLSKQILFYSFLETPISLFRFRLVKNNSRTLSVNSITG